MAYLGRMYDLTNIDPNDEAAFDRAFGKIVEFPHRPISAIEQLRSVDQWVCWKHVTRPGAAKPTKPPVNPHNGRGASHSDPSTWGSYKRAAAAKDHFKLDGGVGYVLSDDDDLTGVDLDGCRDPQTGQLEPWAAEIVALSETYAEVSPSKTGIRMFVCGKVDRAIKSDVARVEIYGKQRYLTVTENHVEGTPLDIRPAPKTLDALIARVEAMKPKREEPQPEPRQSAPRTNSGGEAGDGERAWAEKALEGVAADLAGIVEGGRNHALNASAYRMGRMVARGWIDQSSVVAALEDACRQNGLWKDDGPSGVRATLNSGLRSGIANPHEGLPDDERETPEDLEAIEIGRKIIEGKAERRASRGTFDPETGEVFEAPPRAEARRPEQKRVVLNIVNAASLAGLPVPPRRWLVQDMIPEAKVTLLYGDGGSGKSLLALQLAAAVATGGEWLGEYVDQGRALYLSAEDEIDEHHRRLDAIDDLRNLEDLDIIDLAGEDAVLSSPMGRDGMMRTTALFAAVRAEVAKRRPSLLIIDNLADVFGGDEIKKLNVRQFLTTLNKLAREFKLTVLLLAHPSVNGMALGSGTSGNVAWSNSVRSRLYFERVINRESRTEDDPDIRVLSTKKANGSAIGGRITVRWKDWKFECEEGVASNFGDLIREAEHVFITLLAQFEREGRAVSDKASSAFAPTVFAKHHDAKGIAKGIFEKAMNRLFASGRIKVEETGPQSRRTRKIAIADMRDFDKGGSDDEL